MRCTVPPDEVYLARLNVWDLNRYMATNSMRGLYYPLTEDIIRQADRHGVVIISEVPAVELKCGKEYLFIFANKFTGSKFLGLTVGTLEWHC